MSTIPENLNKQNLQSYSTVIDFLHVSGSGKTSYGYPKLSKRGQNIFSGASKIPFLVLQHFTWVLKLALSRYIMCSAPWKESKYNTRLVVCSETRAFTIQDLYGCHLTIKAPFLYSKYWVIHWIMRTSEMAQWVTSLSALTINMTHCSLKYICTTWHACISPSP